MAEQTERQEVKKNHRQTRAEKKADPNRLSFGHLMIWKSSDISQAWSSLIVLNYLSIYASDTLGISVGVIGVLLLASKIVDAITDIFAGWLIDNTHTRFGKGRPYEPCIIGMTICTILLFAGDPAWSNTIKCVWIFSMYTLIFSIFSTLRGAAGTPYTIRHFHNNELVIRKMSSYGGVVIMVGAMIVSTVFPTMMATIATTASGWTAAVAIIMIPATLIGLLRFFICKEDPKIGEESKQQPIRLKEIAMLFKRNKYVWIYALIMLCYNIMTNLAVGTYYFKWVIGNVSLLGITSAASVILLPLMFAFPWMMQKIGSMCKMIAYFCMISIAGFTLVFFANTNVILVILGYMIGNLAVLPLTYFGILFLMDICTYNEMLGMPRMDASSNILSSFMSKTGSALGSWVTGIMLMLGGYISAEGVSAQPASAIYMIRVDYSLIPIIALGIIMICCFSFAKLEPKTSKFNADRAAAEKTSMQASAESAVIQEQGD